jgi:phosphotriesterase-related protein
MNKSAEYSMTATTVTGPVAASELGLTLAHEHLFIDLRNQFTPFEDEEKRLISEQPVQMANLGRLRRSPYAVRDNLVLDDLELAVAEAREFQKLGGRTIVDCTSIGIRREPLKLRELAKRTGLHIIAGCGYYTHDTHPPEMDDWPAEQIAEEMVRDLTEGMEGTDVKAGIIGEIGTSDPIHPNEKKNLIASALAWRSTPVAVFVHTYPWGKAGLEAAEILIERGVDPAKIVICHIDVEFDVEYIKALLRKGVFVEFDNFGKEFYIDPADRGFAGGVFARDIERVRVLKELTAAGYRRQILVTNDICLKSMLRHYGGWGYDHILRNIMPMMRDEGLSPDDIEVFLRDNPQRLLAV